MLAISLTGLAMASQSASMQLTSARSPYAIIGGGGGTTYTYSSTNAVTPYGNHVCWESSYELARYGPLNFCGASGGGSIVEYSGGAICVALSAMQIVNAQQGEFKTNAGTVLGWLSCAFLFVQILFQGIGSASSVPAPQLIHAGR